MSAAAAARPKRNRRTPLPPELNEEIETPEKNFGKVPNSFWSALRHKFQTGFEKDIASLLAEKCYGGHADGRGGWKNPKWVELSASEVAIEFGNVDEEGHPKTEGIEKCLRALESDGRRLIESKLVGRVKHYRLCPENFDLAADRQVRSLERKPPEAAEEAHIRDVKPSEPLILLAGEKSRPFVLGDYRGKFTSGFQFPITVFPSIDEDGDLDIAIRPHAGERQAKTDSRTPVRPSAREHENNGHLKVESRQKAAADEIERAETGLMKEFLNRWFGKEIGSAPESITKHAIELLGSGSREDFARWIKKRASQVEFLSWKLVLNWAADVGREAAKRNARRGRPEVAEPVLSDADLEDLDRFKQRQAERFGK